MEEPFRQQGARGVGPRLRCLYCGASRRTAEDLCGGCGAEPPSVPCTACGRTVTAPVDRCVCGETCMAWVEDGADGLVCPRCRGSIWRVQLDATAVHVEQCSRCLGCFARTADFSELLELEDAGQGAALRSFIPVATGRELPRQALLATVKCPHCRRDMDRARFAQRASLIVDVCPTHGIWLDAGELVAVLDFISHRRTGSVVPGPAEREDEERWSRISILRDEEERFVDLHAARAEDLLAQGVGPLGPKVLAATALGGPWLGLFVALKGKLRR